MNPFMSKGAAISWLALAALALASPASAADPQAGAAKAEACFACHGGNGVSIADDIPNLAAQKAKYLEGQLAAFLDGKRKNPLMNAIAGRVNKEDVPDIAAYFAGLPGAEPGAKSEPVASINASKVSFQKDYKADFVHYHTINFPATGQVRLYYANKAAADAARVGQPMPRAAVFFTEVFTARKGADGKPEMGADGFFVADKLITHTAMEMGEGFGADIPDLLRNGEWNYAVFSPQGQMRPVNHAACLACHIPQAENSYVFTLKELAAKVKE